MKLEVFTEILNHLAKIPSGYTLKNFAIIKVIPLKSQVYCLKNLTILANILAINTYLSQF